MIKPDTMHKLFYTPVWEFTYPDFVNDKQVFLDCLATDGMFITERERNNLVITRANLHKEPAFQHMALFIKECSRSVFNEMGYIPSCAITSMWATKQRKGGFHHQHIHQNTFLAGAFYLHDLDWNSYGTTFTDTSIGKNMINPAVQPNRHLMIKQHETFPFKEGKLVMFPAWAAHQTFPSQSNERIVIAANIMPVGMTNTDHFDRYNYPDVAGLPLKEYVG